MQILILGSAETLADEPQYYENYLALLQAAAPNDSTTTVHHALFDDLHIVIGEAQFTIHNLEHDIDVANYDVVMLRGRFFRIYNDVLKMISIYAQQHGTKVINDYSDFRSGSKLDQAVRFHLNDVPSPLTTVVTKAVIERSTEISEIVFPCIMKATLGAHGADNHVVQDWAEVARIQDASPNVRFILQQLVPNDGDMRLLLIGGSGLVIRRQAKAGSHLNNTSQGGTASLESTDQLPAPVLAAAVRVVADLGFIIAGVDIIQDKHTDNYYFLEVNSQPQLMSGAFLEAKQQLLAQYLATLQSNLK